MRFERLVEYLAANWLDLLVPIGTFSAVLLVGWIGRRLLFSRLGRLAARTK